MKELLKEHGLRITPQRLELLRILEKQGHRHPSFSEICKLVKRRYPATSQSTILKNLATFEKLNLVSSFSYKGETRYEVNPTPHVNLVDSNGVIHDIEGEDIAQIIRELLNIIKRNAGVKAKHLLILAE